MMLKKLLLVSTLLFPAGLLADECFCLIDRDDGLWFDCRVAESGQMEETIYTCADPGAGGERKSLGAEARKRIPAGTSSCMPCRLAKERGGPPPTPRGPEE